MASAGVGLGSGGGTGGGSSVGVGATVGGGSLASVSGNVGGTGVNASVLGGGSVASACVGTCGATAPGTGTPGTGTPGATPGTVVTVATRAAPLALVTPTTRMRCAKGGNSQVYNGFALVDRSGTVIGTVHDTTLDSALNIRGVRVLSAASGRCVGLEGGAYFVSGTAVGVNMDANRIQ